MKTMKKELFKDVIRLLGYIACLIILCCFINNHIEDIQNSTFLMINTPYYTTLISIYLITLFIMTSYCILFEIKVLIESRDEKNGKI